jgi:RimJ/RimL family protein N-acetyltransferase
MMDAIKRNTWVLESADMNHDDQKANINFQGDLVALGPLRRDLAPLYQKWDNDFLINRTTAAMRPVTLEAETEGYDHYSNDPRYVLFTIYERSTNRPIGKTYLSDIHERTAEFGIVIGEIDCQGKGYGTETTRLMLDYAFTVLGLQNVMLLVYEYNLAGIRAYQKAGFREFGRRREAKWMNGRFWDVIYMDCIAGEFESIVLKKMFHL